MAKNKKRLPRTGTNKRVWMISNKLTATPREATTGMVSTLEDRTWNGDSGETSSCSKEGPKDARALALRAALYAQRHWSGVGLDGPLRDDPDYRSGLALRALTSARGAEALFSPPDAAIHEAIARAYYANCRTEHTIAAARRALEISPEDPNSHGVVGNWVAYVGRWSEGAAFARRAIELAPGGYGRWWCWPIGKAAWIAGDYEETLARPTGDGVSTTGSSGA